MPIKILAHEIQAFFEGDVLFDSETLLKYSHDASLFMVTPTLVVFPKTVADIENLISFVTEHQNAYPGLSLTARSAGTDMTGAAIGEGIIMDFTKYFNQEDVDLKNMEAKIGPGLYFRDFEKDTLPKHVSMPVYPASKGLAAFGGMIMNNCGGEKSLRYGQMRNFVNEMKVVLSDSQEYTFHKLTMDELRQKMAQGDFEAEIYKNTFNLIDENYDVIKSAKPKTSKNSSGYALWDVYDRDAGTFDLTQLFVGSQGTLGIMTESTIRLIEVKEHTRLVVLFFKNWNGLPDVVNKILPLGVDSMETFDDVTLKLGLRFMPEIAKKVGKSFISFALQFLPEVLVGIKMLGLPKLIVLVEVAENSAEEADKKALQVVETLKGSHINYRVIKEQDEADKYWVMRRESFNLLRTKVKGKRTAPFIDDICVTPDKLPVILPEVIKILKEADIAVNIAGHAGSGNLHIIPLMDLTKKEERDKITPVANKIYDLIIANGGTITAEHNDGIIRTPYVKQMFGEQVYALFRDIKNIFDPNNIFNPGKKVGGTIQYMEEHISDK